MRVFFVAPLEYGGNAALDVITHALDQRLTAAGIDLRVVFGNLASPDWLTSHDRLVDDALAAGVDGIVLYVTDPTEPVKAAAAARGAGVPVFTFERARFPVTASVAFPNFNHGVYMTEELAAAVPGGGKLVIIGGPPVIDEAEQLAGVLHALEHTDLQLENDPEADRYRNLTDARPRAAEIMVDVLADFPEIDALMPYNDETMLGALPILEQSGRAGDMKVVARNGTPDAVAAVREGRVHGTWDIDCPGIGALMGDLVVRRLVDGEDLDGDVALSPVGRMLTAATLHRWVPWDERVPPVPLKVGLD